jgi:hypothetical protein
MPTLATLTIQVNSTDAAKAAKTLADLTAAGLTADKTFLKLRDSSAAVDQAHRKSADGASVAQSSFRRLITTAVELIGIYSTIQTVRSAFANAATEERVAMGLTNITGSASQARDMIRQLNDYAQSSQFGIANLETSARMLANMGFDATEVVPTLRAIGNEIEATGGRANDLDDVVRSLARMNDEGQISTFTLRQMEQVGIPAGKLLAQALNESIVDVMKDVREGTLNAHTTLQLLIRSMAEFGNSSDHAKDSVYTLWNTLQNSLSVTLKNMAGEFLHAFDVKVGLQSAIDAVRMFDTGLKDVFNVIEGGNPKFQQTQQIVNVLSATFRILMVALEAIVALQLASWALNFASSLITVAAGGGTLLGVLAAIVAIDFGAWLSNNSKGMRDFVIEVKEAAGILNELRKFIGSTGGNIGGNATTILRSMVGISLSPQDKANLKAGNDQTDQDWQLMKNRMSQIMDQSMHDISKPFTASGTGNYLNDSQLMNNVATVKKFFSGGIGSLDFGGLMSTNMSAYTKQLQQALQVQQGQLSPMNSSSAFELSQQKSDEIQKDIDKLKEEQMAVGATNDLRKQELAIFQERQKIGEKLLANDQQARDLLEQYIAESQKLTAMQQIGEITKGIGDAAGHAFGEFVTGAKTAKQAVRELMQEIEKMAVNKLVTQPLSNLMDMGMTGNPSTNNGQVGGMLGLLGKMFHGIFTPNAYDSQYVGSDWNTINAGSLYGDANMEPGVGQALGGAWNRGVQLFADGGIVGSPTFFGMAGGNTGLMGEAGPEGILPLTRGSDGKLGVKGGGSTVNNNNNQNITMHVHTNDADSFKRSSRQIRQSLNKG